MNPTQLNAGEELRRSYRIPAVDQRTGRMRVGKLETLVEIRDESAGGFGIAVYGKLNCYVGQVVAIQTETGWAKARIMYAYVAQVPSDEEPGNLCTIPQTRLGLLRVHDHSAEVYGGRWAASLMQMVTAPWRPFYTPVCAAVIHAVSVLCWLALVVWALKSLAGS